MSQFKAGDTVVCEINRPYVTIGKKYKVLREEHGNVFFIDDEGDENYYTRGTFKLVEDKKIDFTKPLETEQGVPVELVYTNGRDPEYPVAAYIGTNLTPDRFTAEGKYYASGDSCHDLRNVVPKPVEETYYANVYKNADGKLRMAGNHETRAVADEFASPNRVGCIKIKLVEGQYDE